MTVHNPFIDIFILFSFPLTAEIIAAIIIIITDAINAESSPEIKAPPFIAAEFICVPRNIEKAVCLGIDEEMIVKAITKLITIPILFSSLLTPAPIPYFPLGVFDIIALIFAGQNNPEPSPVKIVINAM